MAGAVVGTRLQVFATLGRTLRRGLARLLAYEERRRQRVALARLSDRLLDDIGVSRDAARAEARKSCWL